MLYMLETLCGDAKRKAFAERELFRVPTPLSHEVGRYLVISVETFRVLHTHPSPMKWVDT